MLIIRKNFAVAQGQKNNQRAAVAKPNVLANKKPVTQEVTNRQIQLAKMRQQTENMRHQRAIQKMQLEKQKIGLRGQLATQRKIQSIRDNNIRIKRLEQQTSNKGQMELFKAKPKEPDSVIVSM